jgi:hypothetical protein
LNKDITIDLENKGRVGSEFTKQFTWIPDKQFSQGYYEGKFSMKQETNNINFELNEQHDYTNTSILAEFPTLKLSNGVTSLRYNLTPTLSDKCLLFNFSKREERRIRYRLYLHKCTLFNNN